MFWKEACRGQRFGLRGCGAGRPNGRRMDLDPAAGTDHVSAELKLRQGWYFENRIRGGPPCRLLPIQAKPLLPSSWDLLNPFTPVAIGLSRALRILPTSAPRNLIGGTRRTAFKLTAFHGLRKRRHGITQSHNSVTNRVSN